LISIGMNPRFATVWLTRFLIVGGGIVVWHYIVALGIMPQLLVGEPMAILRTVIGWFASGKIYYHLLITLFETALSFTIGSSLGFVCGLVLALNPFFATVFDPFFKAFNAMPRVVLAPIFAVWFGLGVWSKVVLGITLVFFITFFNVIQGVREVNKVIVNNSRILGANRSQLIRYVYIPSAMGWVFSSLHNAVGMAFVGAVIGEYLGSAAGIGYLILQAEGVFDTNAVMAGIVVLTICALVLDVGVSMAERRLLRWHPNFADMP
jgi:NitT/TauT family transport system permease protein